MVGVSVALALLAVGCSGGSGSPDSAGAGVDPGGDDASGGGGSGGGGTPAPTVLALSPESVFAPASTPVEIRGTDFSGTTGVTFGGVPASSFDVLGPNRIVATVPAGLSGPLDVGVRTTAGTGWAAADLISVSFPVQVGGTDMQVDTSLDANPSIRGPRVVADGSNFYVVWAEVRTGGAHDIHFRASHDGGATWSVVDRRVNTNAAGESSSLEPDICCDGKRVYVTWVDNRNGYSEPYFNRSLDGGLTWAANDTRISPASGNILSQAPSVACDGNSVLVTWADDRNAAAPFQGADVWANRSLDAGATWLARDARISSTAPGAMRALVQRPRPHVYGSSACVAWVDWRNGNSDAFLDRSTDGGATWQGTDLEVNTDTTVHSVSDLVLAADGSRVYLAWRARQTDGDLVLFARSSANGGASFLGNEARVDHAPAGVSVGVPVIACRGAVAHVVWTDARNELGPEVWSIRSTDGGAHWAATDVRLNDAREDFSRAVEPAIACNASGAVHVAWIATQYGLGGDVFVQSSIDDGASWAANAVRLDTDEPASANSKSPSIAASEALFFVAWQDDRNAATPLSRWDVFGNGNGR